MNYQTLFNDATNWLFADVTHLVSAVAVLAVLGALNGIRLSLAHCGRKVR